MEIKKYVDDKSSVSFSFKKKTEKSSDNFIIECTGFEVKVYGDSTKDLIDFSNSLILEAKAILVSEERIERIIKTK